MIALDPRTTALVLIDLQNGVLGRKLAPISADELVARGKALAEKFRAAGALVVLVNAALRAEDEPRAVDEPSQLPEVLPGASSILHPALPRPATF
jgi:nicotinamidase-related amidase